MARNAPFCAAALLWCALLPERVCLIFLFLLFLLFLFLVLAATRDVERAALWLSARPRSSFTSFACCGWVGGGEALSIAAAAACEAEGEVLTQLWGERPGRSPRRRSSCSSGPGADTIRLQTRITPATGEQRVAARAGGWEVAAGWRTGFGEPLLEQHFGLPPELLHFRAVDPVPVEYKIRKDKIGWAVEGDRSRWLVCGGGAPQIVEHSVFDILEVFALLVFQAERLEQTTSHVEVGVAVLGANAVDLACRVESRTTRRRVCTTR